MAKDHFQSRSGLGKRGQSTRGIQSCGAICLWHTYNTHFLVLDETLVLAKRIRRLILAIKKAVEKNKDLRNSSDVGVAATGRPRWHATVED